MEKVSPHGYVVEISEGTDWIDPKKKWKHYSIVADSFLELIAGIDSIESAPSLVWKEGMADENGKGFAGLPHKSEGKWHATFRVGHPPL